MPGGLHPPPLVIAEWSLQSNPVHPSETRDWNLVVAISFLYGLAILTVTARLWARFVLLRNAGLDDVLVMIAMLPLTGLAISTCLASRLYGFDRHVWDMTPDMAVNSRIITVAVELNYMFATCLVKISILVFYRRLAKGSISKIFLAVVQASIVFIVLYLIGACISPLLACKPLDALWKSVDIRWLTTHKKGVDWKCYNEGANDIAVSSISVTQDFLACGLPSILLWKLQLPRRQKIALGAIFSVGLFLCVAGIFRIMYVRETFYRTYDVTWTAQGAFLWTNVEAMVAVICASAPALKVFFRQCLSASSFGDKIRHSFRRTSDTRNGFSYGIDAPTLGTSAGKNWVSSTAKADKVKHRDVELGSIEVIKEFDVVSIDSRSELSSEHSSSGHGRDERVATPR